MTPARRIFWRAGFRFKNMIPSVYKALALAIIAGPVLLLWNLEYQKTRPLLPETVIVPPGTFNYRASGEYLKDGFPVDAPMIKVIMKNPVEIMKYQVRAGEYEKCVAQKFCKERSGQGRQEPNKPVTGVSHVDALNYIRWFNRQTGQVWRLPTDQEWAYAAGTRFADDAINARTDNNNPAERWLARYQKYANLEKGAGGPVEVPGHYGANENGIYDMSGNVWEWTDTCYTRVRLDRAGRELSKTDNCGVRIGEGRHRAYISFFIQDATGGGCSVGASPDYLGFRMVKDVEH